MAGMPHAPCSLLKLSAAYPNAEGDGGEGDGVPFRKNLQTVEGFGREIVYVRDLSEFAEAVGNGNFRVFGGRVESRENFGGAKAAVGVEQNSRCRIVAGKELEKSVGGIVRKPQRARAIGESELCQRPQPAAFAGIAQRAGVVQRVGRPVFVGVVYPPFVRARSKPSAAIGIPIERNTRAYASL